MELRPGFKRTEVGVIPEEWDVTHLRTQLSEPIRNGYSPVCPEQETGRWMLSLSAVSADGFQAEGVKPAPAHDPRVAENLLAAGDLLISRSNTPDRVGLAGVYEGTPAPCAYPDLLMRVRLKNSLDRYFLLRCLLSPLGRKFFGDNARGSSRSMVKIDRAILESFPIPTPSLKEQRVIATALSDVDALLTQLDRLIAKKRDIKQAAMQQLLTGKTRLPGFEGEWEVRRLGEHVTFLRNGVHSRAELTSEGSVKYLHYGDIHTSPRARLDPLVTAMPHLPSHKAATLDRLRTGDLVFADASEDMEGVGKSVEIGTIGDGCELVSGLHTIAARFDRNILANAFKAYLQFCPEFRIQLYRLAAGTKVYATTRNHIASIEIALPYVAEQTAIATILSDLDTELATLEARRDKTRALKQGMMQALLTGRTRLV